MDATLPPVSLPPDIAITPATLNDLDALIDLEQACFTHDRMSRRAMRHALTKGHGRVLIGRAGDGETLGYALVLFSRGHSLARLYSIAVRPGRRGEGFGRALLEAVEDAALQETCAYLRLEVRADNQEAQHLYQAMGYRPFGRYERYYDDDADALRMEKALAPHLDRSLSRVPYFPQSTGFTCGPACLIMAMNALDPDFPADRRMELRLWREATTIFMQSGHGGCSPFGLALAADRHGFKVSVFVNAADGMFQDTVRSPEKKEIMRIVEEDFRDQIATRGILVEERRLTLAELEAAFQRGATPVVLVSTYAFDREKTPHWLVIVGFDQNYVYVHDPFVDYDEGRVQTDYIGAPIVRADFERISRYGRARHRAVLLIEKGEGKAA